MSKLQPLYYIYYKNLIIQRMRVKPFLKIEISASKTIQKLMGELKSSKVSYFLSKPKYLAKTLKA